MVVAKWNSGSGHAQVSIIVPESPELPNLAEILGVKLPLLSELTARETRNALRRGLRLSLVNSYSNLKCYE